jgi:S-disulfanyl-L-cysteine oxidoreductase SoxD
MSRSRRNRARLLCLGIVWTAVALAADAAPAAKYGLGAPASSREIAGWDIDVMPDGTGLPKGRGSVAEGQTLYDAKCASCHGTFGESNSYLQIAGGVGTLASGAPIRTTGSKLNYATTLFDYIRRAMPFGNPQTLTNDEVYALTAYVLNLNDIVSSDTVLDQGSLPRVKMPNRDGFTTAHGFMRSDGKPDTANVACMQNCAAQVRLSSELPAYARDGHGDLSTQRRALGGIEGLPTGSAAPAVVAPVDAPVAGSELAKRLGCLACHGLDSSVVGPAFRAIAARYGRGGSTAIADADARLVSKIRTGGAGSWGTVPMPAQPQVDAADAKVVVQWILAGAR